MRTFSKDATSVVGLARFVLQRRLRCEGEKLDDLTDVMGQLVWGQLNVESTGGAKLMRAWNMGHRKARFGLNLTDRSPSMGRVVVMGVLGVIVLVSTATMAMAQPAPGDTAKTYEQMVERGINYLRTRGQSSDGSYNSPIGPGVTSLITTALMRHGRSPDDPMVGKSLAYLEQFVQPDGSIAKPGSRLPNYETCLAVMCFSEANRGGRYDAILKKADGYLKGQQFTEGRGSNKSDVNYGGAGYGGDSRPDLSNTAFLVDALKATGNDADSEAIQRALLFVSRCQNLETELTVSPSAVTNPDGGFFYTVAAGGASPAGKTDEGALRSYGAMTYAGLKSMIYAGLTKDDKRYQAALQWLSKNYSVSENPGMGQAGVYYYYHTLAKTMDAMGADKFTAADGKAHDWRADLIAELARRQQDNGSWVNTDRKWMEGDPNLVTGFALLALSYTRPK